MPGEITQINRIIRSAIEKPSETDLLNTVLDPNGGEIKLPVTLVNWRGRDHLKLGSQPFDPDAVLTMLSPEQFDESLTNSLRIEPLASYHKFGTVYLNRIQIAINRIIEAVDNYNRGQHVNLSQARSFLQGALIFFEDTIIETLGGKRGILAHHIAGMRLKYSMMTPAAGSHEIAADEVLIPKGVAEKMHVSPGDMLMVHREPLLWGRGIQFLLAVVSDKADMVRLPWSVFQGQGADCVAEGTPVVIGKTDGSLYTQSMSIANTVILDSHGNLITIPSLTPSIGQHVVSGLSTMDRHGNAVSIQQAMNKGTRPTVDIVTRHGGLVRVTPDHRVSVNGHWVPANEIKLGDIVDMGQKSSLPNATPTSKEAREFAWAMGLFAADGTAGYYLRTNSGKNGDTRYEFRISNNDLALLERAKTAIEKHFNMPMAIQHYPSEKPGALTRFHTDKQIYHLVVSGAAWGQKKLMVLDVLDNCTVGKEKKVPDFALSNPELGQAWLDGFFAGDGDHGDRQTTPLEPFRLTVGSPAILMGLPLLTSQLGHEISIGRYKDKQAFYVNVRVGGHTAYKPNEVIYIAQGPETRVYDITTNGEFLAGRNVVHNCDGDLIFLCNVTRHLDHVQEEDKIEALMEIFGARSKDSGDKEYAASLLLIASDTKDSTVATRVDDTIGLSFGVEDILMTGDDDTFLEVLDVHHGIKPERILSIARDLRPAEWGQEILKTAKALYYTKTSLGIVGAMGSACLALGTAHPEVMPGAVAIKQGLSQAVLDAKHGNDLDHIQTCLEALLRTGKFEEASVDTRFLAMVAHGFDEGKMASLFLLLGDEGLVTRVYRDFPALLLTTTDSHVPSLLARFTKGVPDRSGPGRDVGAWWDRCLKGEMHEV